MDPNDPVTQQYLFSALAIVVGASGFFLPYKWNVLRLRGSIARRLSEKTARMVPKVVGVILIVAGVLLAAATSQIGAFE